MAPLCGVNKRACIRKYGGYSIQSEFCHEVALRLLAGALIKNAAVHETSAEPLFSFYSDHYIRLYARLDKGAKLADQKISEMGFIKYCKKCLYRESSYHNKKEKCPKCDEYYVIAGPLWLGELADRSFMKLMLEALSNKKYLENTKSASLLRMVNNEIGYPVGFYDIDKICSLIGSKSISTSEAIERIKHEGYTVTVTHFGTRSIKTDANIFELSEILTPRR
jgi:tRNA (guanine26-N2/guanine27-N2)-dimethyltransferase